MQGSGDEASSDVHTQMAELVSSQQRYVALGSSEAGAQPVERYEALCSVYGAAGGHTPPLPSHHDGPPNAAVATTSQQQVEGKAEGTEDGAPPGLAEQLAPPQPVAAASEQLGGGATQANIRARKPTLGTASGVLQDRLDALERGRAGKKKEAFLGSADDAAAEWAAAEARAEARAREAAQPGPPLPAPSPPTIAEEPQTSAEGSARNSCEGVPSDDGEAGEDGDESSELLATAAPDRPDPLVLPPVEGAAASAADGSTPARQDVESRRAFKNLGGELSGVGALCSEDEISSIYSDLSTLGDGEQSGRPAPPTKRPRPTDQNASPD
jgi:hypothetical protein